MNKKSKKCSKLSLEEFQGKKIDKMGEKILSKK